MSKAWESTGTFVNAPAGAHVAVLVGVTDLGTQASTYQGEEKPPRRQTYLTWELPHELMEDGRPFKVNKFYTASLGEKSTLYKDLTSWLGKPPTAPFDPKTLLGKGCQVVIVENEDSGKIKVSAVVGLPKGTTVPKETVNPLTYFSLDEFDEEAYAEIPKGIQNIIAKSPEYAAVMSGDLGADSVEAEEDIPF